MSDQPPAGPHVAVLLDWAMVRPDVDPLTGAVSGDERSWGLTAADEAALEWGLRLGERWGWPVRAISAGPVAAEAALRLALAAGVDDVVRVELGTDEPSWVVAAALAGVIRAGATSSAEMTSQVSSAEDFVVIAGDYSADGGSGSVPAFVAAQLDATQALGLVAVDPSATAGELRVVRRLDGGRREVLEVTGPAVLSVEGATARLRRGSLPATIAAHAAPIRTVITATEDSLATAGQPVEGVRKPYRPRARMRPAPAAADARARIAALYGGTSARTPGRALHLDPDAAADAILDALRAWGELDR